MRIIDTLEFLNILYADLPENQYLTILSKKPTHTYWFKSLEAAADKIAEFETDVWIGVGTGQRKKRGRLKSEEVECIPGLWIDIDVKGPAHKETNLPPDIDTALSLLSAIPFEPTLIIDSGHGLQAYWLFREPWLFETAAEHDKAQNILARLQSAIKNSTTYKLDSTHDLARILRPVGSTNYKRDPKPVTVLQCSDNRYNPDDFDGVLPDITPTSTEKRGTRFKRTPGDGPARMVLDSCKFVQYCRDNAKTLPEPYWIAMIGNIARCSDGPEICHELSRPYPKYTAEETNKKISHSLNDMHPQTCEYIRSLGFTGCPTFGCGVKSPCGWALDRKKRENKSPFNEPEYKRYNLTDLGNAERFADMFKGQVKYCSHFGRWLIWDGRRWSMDETGQIMKYAKKCVRSMYGEAGKIDDSDERKALLKHAQKSESLARMIAITTLSQHMMAITVDELDSDKWLLNVLNGTIDLRTAELKPHDPADNITKLAPINYNPHAKCNVFTEFVCGVFAENENIIQFVQRFLGYCLTGDTREQKFMIAWGNGQNGKGTLLNLILDILGDYAETTPADTIMAKRSEGIPNDIARLRGARYVLASETQKGRRMNEALVKQMTGQDRMAARFLHQEFFEFWPQFKIVLLTNDRPPASGDDPALWRRIMLTPFTQKFEGAKCDNTLRDRLRDPDEMAGVFRWLIDGCLAWQKDGLQPPDEVIQATTEYRNENDIIGDWLEECCVIGTEYGAKIADLYKSFEEWSLKNGEKHFFNKNKFSQGLSLRGFSKYRGTGGVRCMHGLGLLATIPDDTCVESHSENQHVDPF